MKTGIGSFLLFVGLVVITVMRGGLPWVTPPVGDFSEVRTEGAGLELLSKCRLIQGRNSDGDSFHVKHEKGETEFRLYFVDAPESGYRTYRNGEDNGKRLDDQAWEFGGVSRSQVVKIGKEAKDFVLEILKQGEFKVLTKWENVYGPERKYCLVIVPWDGAEVYLHELLVVKGLVRVHTKGTDLPGGRSRQEQERLLEKWEKEVGVVTGG
jgi:endonuclease YncB( thermonuclease family)